MRKLGRSTRMLLILGILLYACGCVTRIGDGHAFKSVSSPPAPPPFKTPHLPAMDCDAVILDNDSDLAFCEKAI